MPALSSTRKLCAGFAAFAVTSSSALAAAGTAGADPSAPPQPINTLQAPGMTAVQQLSPAIQQAAMNPQQATSLLMAAAAAFAGNSAAPDDSKRVASSVNQFVQEPTSPARSQDSAIPSANINLPGAVPGVPVPTPNNVSVPGDLNQLLPAGVNLPGTATPPPAADPAAHVAAPGVSPDGEAHLPAGVDPAHAVGPAPEAAPAAPAPETPVPAPPAFGPDTPPTQEFMYPSIGNGCLSDGGNSLATALSVAGPASIPKPGPGKGQTAYVFTAVGTPAPAAQQKLPLNVTWVNLTTGKSGTATLKPNPEINPNGPTTLMAIVDTGSGSIMSTIFGQVTTVDKQCTFMPTIGSTVVP
jgi:hypothetical protein